MNWLLTQDGCLMSSFPSLNIRFKRLNPRNFTRLQFFFGDMKFELLIGMTHRCAWRSRMDRTWRCSWPPWKGPRVTSLNKTSRTSDWRFRIDLDKDLESRNCIDDVWAVKILSQIHTSDQIRFLFWSISTLTNWGLKESALQSKADCGWCCVVWISFLKLPAAQVVFRLKEKGIHRGLSATDSIRRWLLCEWTVHTRSLTWILDTVLRVA